MENLDNIIKLKNLTELEKAKIKQTLIEIHLMKINNAFDDLADYIQIDSLDYWKDYIPISKPIISGSKFIKIFHNILNSNSKK